jgi:hypothetical protein
VSITLPFDLDTSELTAQVMRAGAVVLGSVFAPGLGY